MCWKSEIITDISKESKKRNKFKKNGKIISFKIQLCTITDEWGESKEIEGKEAMYINDIEYAEIQEFLESKYGISSEFDKLDKEVEKALKETKFEEPEHEWIVDDEGFCGMCHDGTIELEDETLTNCEYCGGDGYAK